MGKELEVAKKAALAGARAAMRYYGKLQAADVLPKGPDDAVTTADLASERSIISVIRKHFPEDGIIGEESGLSQRGSSGRYWALDPIDGTTNFIRGFDFFAVCVAVFREREPIAAAVCLPVQKRLYTAERGRGAFCNGKRIRVSRESNMQKSIILCSISGVHRNPELFFPRFERILKQSRGVRVFNSCAADLCFLAEGRADGYFSTLVKLWDFAAAALVLQEAGGRVVDDHGNDWRSYLSANLRTARLAASNRKIHKKLLDTIIKARGGL